MALFSPSFLDALRAEHDPARWPGVLGAAQHDVLRRRLEGAVALAPGVVRPTLQALLTSESVRDLFLGRALLWSLGTAGLAGARPVEILGDETVRMRAPGGDTFVLSTLLFHTGETRMGPPEAVERLLEVLESTFAGRRYALHVRRPLSEQFDDEAVARAVTLWVHAVERGEWRGRHAVYEDERLSMELTLLDAERRDDGDGLTFFVGPSASLERLSTVDARLQQVMRIVEPAEGPVLTALVAAPAWRLTRGYVTQLLYGTADEVVARGPGGEIAHRARYASDRYSLFADPQFARLAALWWLEASPTDPLGVRGRAHVNPWRTVQGSVPAFPGSRYRVVPPDERDDAAGPVMTWEGHELTRFEGGEAPAGPSDGEGG